MEVIIAMFEGLLIRAVRNPDLDQGRVVQMFQRIGREPAHSARQRRAQAHLTRSSPRAPPTHLN